MEMSHGFHVLRGGIKAYPSIGKATRSRAIVLAHYPGLRAQISCTSFKPVTGTQFRPQSPMLTHHPRNMNAPVRDPVPPSTIVARIVARRDPAGPAAA
jgi:hypothetical protein